jgi:hypothetical protein
MSKQYQKRKAKKADRHIKADSRYTVEEAMVKAVGTDEYVPMRGDSVTHKLHTSYGVGKVKSSVLATGSTSVYWPDNDHTTVQGSHVLRNKKLKNTTVDIHRDFGEAVVSHQEEPERGRRDRSKAENARMREDKYALAIGNRVKHAHHKAFGVGRILKRRGFGSHEYRWDISWDDGRNRTHGADYLISLDGPPINPAKKETARGDWFFLPPEQKEGLWVTHVNHDAFGVGTILFQHQNIQAGVTNWIDLYRVRWKHNTERDHKAIMLRLYKRKAAEIAPTGPDLFLAGDEVVGFSGDIGVVARMEHNGVTLIDWGDGVRRPELATCLRRMDSVRPKDEPIKQTKEPNPNRAFRSQKIHGRRKSFGGSYSTFTHHEVGVSTQQPRCAGCGERVRLGTEKIVRNPGEPTKLYCDFCFNERHSSTPRLPAAKRASAATRNRLKKSVKWQISALKDYARRKGLTVEQDFDSLSYEAAEAVLNQWKTLPDVAPDAVTPPTAECSVCGEPCTPFDVHTPSAGKYFLACSDRCKAKINRRC